VQGAEDLDLPPLERLEMIAQPVSGVVASA